MRASELRRGDTFFYNNWAYTVLTVGPHEPKRGTYKFQARSPVETTVQFEFFDDMTRYVSTGDKVK